MKARLSIHVPDEAVHERELAMPANLVIGRDPRCDLVVSHHSISRRHLRLSCDPDGQWSVEDLGSKNGTRVDGRMIAGMQPLSSAGWFAAGDVYLRLERIDSTAEGARRSEADRRRSSSMIWNKRLLHGNQGQRLIGELLQGVVETADAERGFLLSLDREGDWRVRACFAMQPDQMGGLAFSGSRGAIERAIAAGRPVYLSDQRDRAWLQQQQSVMDAGIRALLAIPLLQDGRALGVVYADTREAERAYTDLDAQLLDALVEHAGHVMTALELEANLAEVSALLQIESSGQSAELGPAPSWSRLTGSHLRAVVP